MTKPCCGKLCGAKDVNEGLSDINRNRSCTDILCLLLFLVFLLVLVFSSNLLSRFSGWPQGARTCPPWPAWAAAFARVGQGGRFSPQPGPQIIFFERAKAQTALKALRRNGARRPDRNIKACARKCVLTGAYHPPKPRPGTSGLE